MRWISEPSRRFCRASRKISSRGCRQHMLPLGLGHGTRTAHISFGFIAPSIAFVMMGSRVRVTQAAPKISAITSNTYWEIAPINRKVTVAPVGTGSAPKTHRYVLDSVRGRERRRNRQGGQATRTAIFPKTRLQPPRPWHRPRKKGTIPGSYVTTERLAAVGCATPGNGPILAGRCPDWKRLLWRLAIHCLPSVVSSR